MLNGSVVTEQPEPLLVQEAQEVVYLEKEDLVAIIKCLMDLSYDSKIDTFQVPPRILDLAEELDVN